MKYSLTQGGILVAVFGTIAVQYLGAQGISEVCSNELVSLIPLVIGGIAAWAGRVRKGDVNIFGFKR